MTRLLSTRRPEGLRNKQAGREGCHRSRETSTRTRNTQENIRQQPHGFVWGNDAGGTCRRGIPATCTQVWKIRLRFGHKSAFCEKAEGRGRTTELFRVITANWDSGEAASFDFVAATFCCYFPPKKTLAWILTKRLRCTSTRVTSSSS